jgi:hypothetical protein
MRRVCLHLPWSAYGRHVSASGGESHDPRAELISSPVPNLGKGLSLPEIVIFPSHLTQKECRPELEAVSGKKTAIRVEKKWSYVKYDRCQTILARLDSRALTRTTIPWELTNRFTLYTFFSAELAGESPMVGKAIQSLA